MAETSSSAIARRRLHVVIPVYDGREQTTACIEALRQDSCYKEASVIVVDHGPTASTAAALANTHPEVIGLRGSPELWWAGATNLGVRWALEHNAELIMLLNNDCYTAPETLSRLLALVDVAGLAIIAPVQFDYATRKVYCRTASSCFLLGFPTIIVPWRRERPRGPRLHRTRLIIGGRGVLIPSEVFKRIGLFDEASLPHYGADHDFFIRARRSGIPLFVALDTAVYIDQRKTTLARQLGHLGIREFCETLTSRRSHRNLRDITALFKKHYPIAGLHYVGVALHVGRYVLSYLWMRVYYFMAR